MGSDFLRYDDGHYHELCIVCYEEGIERVEKNGKTLFRCWANGHEEPRRIVIDPEMQWWVADGVLWHESVGVFVRNRAGKFLFFRRSAFPENMLTVPSGHVDRIAGRRERPGRGARRELREETALRSRRIRHVATEDIAGDLCRRGADYHRWHAYLLVYGSSAGAARAMAKVRLNDEGKKDEGKEEGMWLTLEAARKTGQLTYPVRFIIERYKHRLEQPGGA